MGNAILTRRRDQRGFKPGMPAGGTVIGGILFCNSAAARDAWVRRLYRTGRFNSFVYFRDVKTPYAVQFGWADWAADRKAPSIQY